MSFIIYYCSIAESVSIPLQYLLCLPSIFIPLRNGDILSCTRQGIGFIEIFHIEAWRVTSAHLLRGIVVALETKTVVLSEDSLPVLETPSATGKEFVLAISLVPIAHLNPI